MLMASIFRTLASRGSNLKTLYPERGTLCPDFWTRVAGRSVASSCPGLWTSSTPSLCPTTARCPQSPRRRPNSTLPLQRRSGRSPLLSPSPRYGAALFHGIGVHQHSTSAEGCTNGQPCAILGRLVVQQRSSTAVKHFHGACMGVPCVVVSVAWDVGCRAARTGGSGGSARLSLRSGATSCTCTTASTASGRSCCSCSRCPTHAVPSALHSLWSTHSAALHPTLAHAVLG